MTCPRCGNEPPEGSPFCNGCGAPLDGTTPERDPRVYTPKHLVEKILHSKSAMEGERKQVTVLFADLKSSMEISESLDPEEWHRILERFFQILADGVHRFEGNVNQYLGDGIMALSVESLAQLVSGQVLLEKGDADGADAALVRAGRLPPGRSRLAPARRTRAGTPGRDARGRGRTGEVAPRSASAVHRDRCDVLRRGARGGAAVLRRTEFIVALLILAGCGGPSATEPLRSPLAVDTPVENIVTNLVYYVPLWMDERGVPGVSIALVRDGEVAWTRGFGVTSSLTDEPVTPDTVFEVASNSKAVTAYAALALVRSGRLSLDTPLNDAIGDPFLETRYRDRVTLRHVLSHTSGMSNLGVGIWVDREVHFEPDARFSYSGHGFMYLQETIESVTGRPFGAYLETAVLEPLGMRASGFSYERVRASHASGHVPAYLILAVFTVLSLLTGVLLWPVAWIVPRLRRPRVVLGVNGAAGLLATFLFLGPSANAGVGLGLVGAVIGVILFILRFGRVHRGVARFAVAAALLLGGYLVTRPAVPIPSREVDFLAAGGLRATAGDLARFLIVAMDVPEMRAPQVRVADHLSWGLGIGIQHASSGDSIWHWGQNPGWESLMVGYPDSKTGVVVLTNGGPPLAGLTLAREVAHAALGGDHYGYWADVPGTFLPYTGEEGD